MDWLNKPEGISFTSAQLFTAMTRASEARPSIHTQKNSLYILIIRTINVNTFKTLIIFSICPKAGTILSIGNREELEGFSLTLEGKLDANKDWYPTEMSAVRYAAGCADTEALHHAWRPPPTTGI